MYYRDPLNEVEEVIDLGRPLLIVFVVVCLMLLSHWLGELGLFQVFDYLIEPLQH